jgi:hypothetical protein
MAVAVNITSGDFPVFEAAAAPGGSVLASLAPNVGAALVTAIDALSAADYKTMIAELVQAVRTIQGG